MKDTLISWAHHTINWWWGCEKVSEACRFCYAEALAKRFAFAKCKWGKGGLRWIRENATRDARKLHAVSKASGTMQRIFVNSMSDTFEDHPGLHDVRAHALSVMEAMPFANWLLLTKRPENVLRMVPEHWHTSWPEHIWIGTTVENQQCADHRVPELLRIPAKVRFLSCEPLLEQIDLGRYFWDKGMSRLWPSGAIQWVICGGESGHNARPMHTDWARNLRDECAMAGVPFHFKQWGEHVEVPAIQQKGDFVMSDTEGEYRVCVMRPLGKKLTGRAIDGVEYDEVPA